MKRILYILAFLFVVLIALLIKDSSHFTPIVVNSADESVNGEANLERYARENEKLPNPQLGENRVVFIGNSITQFWVTERPQFFSENNYIGRGIAGQTSPQLLMRFRQDVVDLKPVVVLINVGVNDIAENTGTYNARFTFDNIKSMADIAVANDIKVILSSVLPANEFPWRKEMKNIPPVIDSLNLQIKNYAILKDFAYIDYNTSMKDDKGGLKSIYGKDEVHPNVRGYELMESIAKPIIDKVLNENVR